MVPDICACCLGKKTTRMSCRADSSKVQSSRLESAKRTSNGVCTCLFADSAGTMSRWDSGRETGAAVGKGRKPTAAEVKHLDLFLVLSGANQRNKESCRLMCARA